MTPKDAFALGRQGDHAEIDRAHDEVHPVMTLLVGSQTRSLSLRRFLFSSTGFHLIFAWILISVGLPTVPSVPKPLVVTIIGSEAESSASSGRLDRTHTRQPAAPGPTTQAVNSKVTAQPRVSPPSPDLMAQATESTASDDRVAEPKSVGVPASESHAAGGAFAVGGLPSGPVLLSSDGDGEVGSSPAGRGGAGRLDAALVAPSTPSVTIGSAQGAGGGG
ncbi:MAG TPA: hypothetical protein VN494_11230, partial [Patescibacteria group bacterium]|nr:hypothetical protein [Patescibacteria group bacterium]